MSAAKNWVSVSFIFVFSGVTSLLIGGCGETVSTTGPSSTSATPPSSTSAVPKRAMVPPAVAPKAAEVASAPIQPPVAQPSAAPDEPPVAPPATPEAGAAPESSAPPRGEEVVAGRKIFDSQGCVRCHSLGGAVAGGPMRGGRPPGGGPGAGLGGGPGGRGGMQGGPPGGPAGGGGGMGRNRGPDLTKVGAKQGRTADWIAAHIRDPKSHNQQSRMPGLAGKISEEDLKTLAEYLAGLK